jgi:hypothetical protein
MESNDTHFQRLLLACKADCSNYYAFSLLAVGLTRPNADVDTHTFPVCWRPSELHLCPLAFRCNHGVAVTLFAPREMSFVM